MTPVADIKDWKREKIQHFAELIDEHPVIGVVDFKNLPAPQLQEIRAELRDRVTLQMTKKSIMQLAFEESEKDIEGLNDHLKGMPALLFTEENPFTLFQTLKEEQSKAPIKAGQEAPNDIVINEGPTDFAPGPIIGELGNAGIPAGVEDGKVAVQQDTTVVQAGETVDADMANLLGRLDIKPVEVGLDLVAVYEDETIFTKDVLDIDTQQYRDDFAKAATHARNVAINTAYPTTETLPQNITQAHNDALALAESEAIITQDTITKLLTQAQQSALALKTTTGG